jgi:hypothetical protein
VIWLRFSRICHRLQFAFADLAEWCYSRYLRAKQRREESQRESHYRALLAGGWSDYEARAIAYEEA